MNRERIDREIERALSGERTVTPSTGFTSRVMRSVHEQADRRQGLPFPWRPLAWGLGTCAALTAAGVVAATWSGAPPRLEGVAALLERPDVAAAMTWVPVSLAGSFLMGWCSLRVGGARR